MEKKRYILLVSVAYALPIMQPLRRAIHERGDEVCWYFDRDEELLESLLRCDVDGVNNVVLRSVKEVMEFDPTAIFTCGNHMYDFFPGVKVQLFHGYPLNKRNDKRDDHFSLRGWFDIYCTQGPTSSVPFAMLAQKHRYFKVYETGWTKCDLYYEALRKMANEGGGSRSEKPTILYSSTFTKGITSSSILAPHIERMVASGEWNWLFMFHPKLDDEKTLAHYKSLAERYDNATFYSETFNLEPMLNADVMLCDTSSIILEFMLLDKPVVTFRNTRPGHHLIDVTSAEEVHDALQEALYRPELLMRNIREYISQHEAHFDGGASGRVLDAVDDFIANGSNGLKSKPLNFIRRLQARKRLHYWRL